MKIGSTLHDEDICGHYIKEKGVTQVKKGGGIMIIDFIQ